MIVAIIACVAGGAFLGGMARYGFSRLLPSPVGTFAANILGAVALGLTVGFLQLAGENAYIHAAAATGFTGGLSTWSTLAKELGHMLKAARYWDFTKYLAATLAFGIIAAWRGTIWAARIYHGF